jgi:hypothetical protein
MSYQNTNVPGYKKHKKTGVVINKNVSELAAIRKQKQAILEKKKLEDKVRSLEEKVEEQNKLLQQVLYEFGYLKAGV